MGRVSKRTFAPARADKETKVRYKAGIYARLSSDQNSKPLEGHRSSKNDSVEMKNLVNDMYAKDFSVKAKQHLRQGRTSITARDEKKRIHKAEDEWVIREDTHESIIDAALLAETAEVRERLDGYFCLNGGQTKVESCPVSNRISKTELVDILLPLLRMEFSVYLGKQKYCIREIPCGGSCPAPVKKRQGTDKGNDRILNPEDFCLSGEADRSGVCLYE